MRPLPSILSALTLAAASPAGAQPAAYESRVLQSFAAAESFQGPMDGGWTLLASGDERLFAIQFSDRRDRLEAAWRDLRRAGALDASGFVDEVQRSAGRLTLRFSSAPGVQDTVTLTAGPADIWSGDLDENGRHRAVSLSKTSP